jgi:Holliday junction resolvase RusA-like endonuclease
MKAIVLSGEPKSTQHIYGLVCNARFPRRYMTDQGRAKGAVPVGSACAVEEDPLRGEVRMHVTLYFGTSAKPTGTISTSCDALNGIAYEDDSQIKQVTVALAYDKHKPRIEIAVAPL